MRRPPWLVVAALALALVQIGVLASMILARAAILRDGREVVLLVEPVDPRDLLRGDYVAISYEISRLPARLFEDPQPEPGRAGPLPVSVRLAPGEDGIWRAVAARMGEGFAGPPAEGEVDIRGVARARPGPNLAFVPVRYGIERFYLPEGEGRPIERGLGARTFRMAVAVAQDGSAQIKALYDGERMIFSEPIY